MARHKPDSDKLNHPAGGDEAITPIDFTPNDGSGGKRSFQLSPLKTAVGLALALFVAVGWFVLSAKSIYFDVQPVPGDVEVHTPLAVKIGPRYLVLAGELDVSVTAEGYYDLEQTLTVGAEQAQAFPLNLTPLPGYLNVTTNAPNASVIIDGEEIGNTPLERIELAAGEHELVIQSDRYESHSQNLRIEGRTIEQDLNIDLLPAWANITFTSSPPGADVIVDGETLGQTPLVTEVLEGEYPVIVKLDAHKAWTETLEVTARQDQVLPLLELEQADGLVLIQTNPSNASVTLDGNYQGQTPLEITVPPGASHRLEFFLNGYEEAERSIITQPGEEVSVVMNLQPIVSLVEITAQPANAELYINGEPAGPANQTVELLAASQVLEIRAPDHVTYRQEFVSRPGLEQKLNVTLKTLEQQRIENIKPLITTVNGQELKLLYPGSFTMGASRREAGRQANEALRDVTLTKPYYLSLTEVTNAQFAEFDPDHSSGVVERVTVSNSNQPVVRVTWNQAALYTNWLSEQEDLEPFYIVENGEVTGFNRDSTGYRLPTEAEWAWAARVQGDPSSLLKFPWGPELPPPENHGNYADLSAASMLGGIIRNYDDSFAVSAPVASFPPNPNGFYDMGGNVAEWVHDYYGTAIQLGTRTEVDPYGPANGTYRVIRGSSWAHGSITELRLSFRDYGNEPRDDVGFRIARTLDLP